MIIFLIIASIIAFIFNMKSNYAEKVSRFYSIPIYLLICLNIIALLIPVRMNLINVKNFENNISKFEREISDKKYSVAKQEKIKESDYDEVFFKFFQIVYKGKKIWLGYARNDKEMVIINSKGEKMTSLCGSKFRWDSGTPIWFFTYLSLNRKYEIELPK